MDVADCTVVLGNARQCLAWSSGRGPKPPGRRGRPAGCKIGPGTTRPRATHLRCHAVRRLLGIGGIAIAVVVVAAAPTAAYGSANVAALQVALRAHGLYGGGGGGIRGPATPRGGGPLPAPPGRSGRRGGGPPPPPP